MPSYCIIYDTVVIKPFLTSAALSFGKKNVYKSTRNILCIKEKDNHTNLSKKKTIIQTKAKTEASHLEGPMMSRNRGGGVGLHPIVLCLAWAFVPEN